MKTPHVHAELIKAWPDGAEIQIDVSRAEEAAPRWADTSLPTWSSYVAYRIKPEPKPDFSVDMQLDEYGASPSRLPSNIKATFDGNTGKLKDIKLIK